MMAVKILSTRQAMQILQKSNDTNIFHKNRKLEKIVWDWGKSKYKIKFQNSKEELLVGNWAYFSYKLRDMGEWEDG